MLYPSNDSKNSIEIINNYINQLKSGKNLTRNEFRRFNKELKDKVNPYYSNVCNIYNNKLIKNIKDLNETIKDIIDLSEFDLQNNNNEINYELENDLLHLYNINNSRINQLEEEFYSNDVDSKSNKETENSLKCDSCFKENGYYYCKHCNFIYGEKYKTNIKKKEIILNMILKNSHQDKRTLKLERKTLLNLT